MIMVYINTYLLYTYKVLDNRHRALKYTIKVGHYNSSMRGE